MTDSIATAFFDAIEHGDLGAVRALYAPEARIWHNTDGIEQTVDQNLVLLEAFVGRTTTRSYLDRRLHHFAGGFVQQHRLSAIRHDGRAAELHAAIICKIDSGRITRLDEYLDSSAVAQFRNG
jgi:ketosteroid isomerase-like protein